jgi:uncharacterized protein YqjF (DUF2071 family)
MSNFLTARWENLVMANYEIDPAILLPYLPAGTQLDFYNGKTFVSLVGFLFVRTRIFGIPIPFMGTFEEVNLRFYVTHKDGNEIKRGVVFINETVPHKIVAWIANKLYKEHYIAIPTRHKWEIGAERKIEYSWKRNDQWNHLRVTAVAQPETMLPHSLEEFIFEHYWGYTRISEHTTEEYQVAHPRWQVYPVEKYEIKCDFEKMYGADFNHLATVAPSSIMLAEGSAISVKWKRRRIES